LIPFPKFLLELPNSPFEIINLAFQLKGIMPFRFEFTDEPSVDDDFLLAFVNA
jgi:hypothetical protein